MTNPWGEHVPDPLSPSGYRWKRHDEPEPTGLLPAVRPAEVEQSAKLPPVHPGQDDLSHLDRAAGELVNTEKVGPLDEVLVQPSQDPEWRP